MSDYDDDEYDEDEDSGSTYNLKTYEEDVAEHPATAATAAESTNDRPAARSRFSGFLLLSLTLFLLPSLLTVTGLAARGLSWVHPELAEVTTFEHLSLHWWAPVECRGLKLRNTRDWSHDAPPLLTAQRAATKQPLWKMLLNPGQAIDVTVVQPKLTLLDSDQGSNLTDALHDLSSDDNDSSATLPFRITIRDGSIQVATQTAPADAADPLSVAEYSFETLASGIQCAVSTLDHAAIPDVSLTARLGSDDGSTTMARSDALPSRTTVHPRVAARLDDLAADFQPLQLETPGRETDDARTIEIQMGSVAEDARRAMWFTARGLRLDVLQPLIAQMFPGVRCRGLLSVKGEALMLGQTAADGFAVRAAARAADVRWRMSTWASGESLQLDTASADCAVAVAEDGIVVQALSVECPFGGVQGDGEIRLPTEQLLQRMLESSGEDESQPTFAVAEAEAAAAGQVNIRGDLNLVPLARMLPQTLQLRQDLELQEGAIRFALRTQSEAAGQSAASLRWEAVLETSPLIARRQRQTIRWDAPVRVECSGPLSLTSTGLHSAVVSGDFGKISYRPNGPAAEIQGIVSVDRLWAHLGQFVDSEPPGIHGDVRLQARVELPSDADCSLQDLTLMSDNLRVESQRLQIRTDRPLLQMLDGQLTLAGNGAAVRSLAAPWTDLSWLASDSSVSLQLDASPPERLTIVGELRPGPTASRSPRPRSVTLPTNSSTLLLSQAQLALDIDTTTKPGEYMIRSGRMRIPGVDAQLSGTLDSSGPWLTARLVVDADYDLELLSRMVLNDPQGNIRLAGRHQSRFDVRGAPEFWNGHGPSDAEPFEVAGEVAWDSADIYGLQLGPGIVPLQLQAGEVRTEPIRCSLNGGQLNAMVNYSLKDNRLALASGSRAENVSVTEELASRWLGYVTPLLADAAGVRGPVSVKTSRFLYDLNHPQHSQLAGTVEIHGITASPGESLTVVLQAVDALRSGRRTLVRDLTLPQQQVRVEMRDGMIAHDQVLLTLSGYHLRTRGAVGLNRQLALTLDVPTERSGEQTSGRFVSVPVQGTVDRPVIDLQRLIQDVGGRRIQDEINEQLDRTFDRLFDKL